MVKEPPILVVDGDPKAVALMCRHLQREGFTTIVAADGAMALELVRTTSPVLILLELLLPDLSGMEVCKRIRERSDVPIVIVTANTEDEEKLTALRTCADDYMVKPFNPRELAARVQAVLRRSGSRRERRPRLFVHGVQVDLDRGRSVVDGQEVHLTVFETQLLVTLMESPGRVFRRQELLDLIYAHDQSFVTERTIDVHIGKLRQKIERAPAHPERILTVRGVGYKYRGVEPQD